MKKIIVVIIIIAVSLALLNACSKKEEKPTGGVDISNPASVNCINNGGKLKIVENVSGQYGVCVLQDGAECEEWAYYRRECHAIDEKVCAKDDDCACGTNIKTGECFIGNKKYVNASRQCPDFCVFMTPDGIDRVGDKCTNNKCE